MKFECCYWAWNTEIILVRHMVLFWNGNFILFNRPSSGSCGYASWLWASMTFFIAIVWWEHYDYYAYFGIPDRACLLWSSSPSFIIATNKLNLIKIDPHNCKDGVFNHKALFVEKYKHFYWKYFLFLGLETLGKDNF